MHTQAFQLPQHGHPCTPARKSCFAPAESNTTRYVTKGLLKSMYRYKICSGGIHSTFINLNFE